jgi:DNA-binding CsgD family transcriptional regulator
VSRRPAEPKTSSSSASAPVTADEIRSALTARELEIYKRLASGESNQQIGRS